MSDYGFDVLLANTSFDDAVGAAPLAAVAPSPTKVKSTAVMRATKRAV